MERRPDMKYLLALALALAIVGLSYISIHAFDVYTFKCDVPAADAPAPVKSEAVMASAGRRTLQVPDWALGE